MNCLKNITVDEVFKKATELISNRCSEPKTPKTMQPILKKDTRESYTIIRDDGIGDLVSCLPAFSAFRKAHLNKKIVLTTFERNEELMELTGCFDEIFPLASKWDDVYSEGKVFDARDLFEGKKLPGHKGCYFEEKSRPEAMADFLRVSPDLDYVLPQDEDAMAEVKLILEGHHVQPEDRIAVIQPMASCRTRTWLRS